MSWESYRLPCPVCLHRTAAHQKGVPLEHRQDKNVLGPCTHGTRPPRPKPWIGKVVRYSWKRQALSAAYPATTTALRFEALTSLRVPVSRKDRDA